MNREETLMRSRRILLIVIAAAAVIVALAASAMFYLGLIGPSPHLRFVRYDVKQERVGDRVESYEIALLELVNPRSRPIWIWGYGLQLPCYLFEVFDNGKWGDITGRIGESGGEGSVNPVPVPPRSITPIEIYMHPIYLYPRAKSVPDLGGFASTTNWCPIETLITRAFGTPCMTSGRGARCGALKCRNQRATHFLRSCFSVDIN
jgi:hypothetical protein